jgi:Txe/YoeB family toxin of toxin-antitoxin system
MNKLFSEHAWDEYLYWHNKDKKILKKIHELIRDIERNGYTGIGKSEALRHELSDGQLDQFIIRTIAHKAVDLAKYRNCARETSE